MEKNRWYAIVLGGGRGSRMGASVNKVLLPIRGEAMLVRSVRAFVDIMAGVIVVIRSEDRDEAAALLRNAGLADRILWAEGGDTRQASVRNGLSSLPNDCTHVAIHDGARCMVDEGTIRRAMEQAEATGAAVAAIPVTDTVKQVDACETVTATPDRSMLRAVQTPQCFSRSLLSDAHCAAEKAGFQGTDDASLVERLHHPVVLTEGSRMNIKLTTPEDIGMAEELLRNQSNPSLPTLRIGTGYDVHRLTEGRRLILCGVDIPHTLGLLGHSDADVALHALMDAMLGAMALGDIGQHFPDSDPQYKGISSMLLLRHVTELLRARGARVTNADITIVAQKPKLFPYIPQMRQNVADTLGLPIDRINVKATTTEHLGFEGEQQGISSQAVVMVESR